MEHTVRPGETRAPVDPAELPGDAKLVFIGRAVTQWKERVTCPKNLRQARERGGGGSIVVDAPWREGLRDLEPGQHIIVLTWFDRASRNLIVQAPRHRETPTGVFSLRSPVRPNPVGVHIVRLVAVDAAAGRLDVDALDCLDGTPIVDIKPWLASVDVPPENAGG